MKNFILLITMLMTLLLLQGCETLEAWHKGWEEMPMSEIREMQAAQQEVKMMIFKNRIKTNYGYDL